MRPTRGPRTHHRVRTVGGSKRKAEFSRKYSQLPTNAVVCRVHLPRLQSRRPLELPRVSTPPSFESPTPTPPSPGDRLESWKEIAAYLRRDVTTAQRWERREGMPVHRHLHDKAGSVYAFRTELDAWVRGRRGGAPEDPNERHEATANPAPAPAAKESVPPQSRILAWALAGFFVTVIAGLVLWSSWRPARTSPRDLLAGARFIPLTNFGGMEQAAAVSRDGRFVAFLSNREGPMAVWVTQVGTGQFYNLTRNSTRELINPSVRTLGFSPDGSEVTFWARTTGTSGRAAIGIWAVPVLGGSPRPYLDGVAEFDWSGDGERLVYHTPGAGDPMFVRDGKEPGRQIFSAPAGLHGHFPVWSPDNQFIYFVQGSVPDQMDIWRLPAAGGTPERLTQHDSYVSHPVFIDGRTLLYLATGAGGFGPSMYSLDIEQRTSRQVSFGSERYTSLSASADGRRLVATVAGTRSTLWRLPLSGSHPEPAAALRPVSLTTGSGSAARSGPGYILYVASKGDSDSIWRLAGTEATEVWSSPETRILGAPAIAHDGRRIAFATRHGAQTSLHVANADGSSARVVNSSLDLTGTPAWEPDGRAITVSALTEGTPRLFRVPLDGGTVTPLGGEHAVEPVWSPGGNVAVYSGPDVGTTFPVKALNRDGSAYPLADLTLTRGSRRLAFMPEGRTLLFLRGDIEHKNIWTRDLESGAERQLTNFGPDISIRDFDISPDGRELIVEQARERSDVVLIEVHR